jgi:hypothetical protein
VKNLKWSELERGAVPYALERIAEYAMRMALAAKDEERRCNDDNMRVERAAHVWVYLWIAKKLRMKVRKIISGT